MSNFFANDDIESSILSLRKDAVSVKFSDDLYFIGANDKFIKCDEYEREIIAEFDGETALGDVIAKRLKAGDSSVFNAIISLIERLNGAELFDEKSAANFKRPSRNRANFQEKTLAVKKLRPTKFLAFCGKIFTSVPFLIFFSLLSLGTFFVPSLKGVNLLTSIVGNVGSAARSYLIAIFFILIFLFIVLSLPAFFSAAGLAANGFQPTLTLKFKFGLLYISANSAQILAKGRNAAFKSYFLPLLSPFVLSAVAALLWKFGISRPATATLYVVATGCGLFSLSPFGNSPLSAIIGFYMKNEDKTLNYLKKRLLKDLLNFKKPSAVTEQMIIVSSFGLIWIYLLYLYFWNVAKSTLSYLFSDFYSAVEQSDVLSQILILISLIFILFPLLSALIRFLLVLFGNLTSIVSTPLIRMKELAGKISAKSVPASNEVIEFLKQIPLFMTLDDNDLAALCKRIRLRKFMKNSVIVKQGAPGDAFYTVVSGKTVVKIENRDGSEKIVETLSTGDSFGETALLEKGRRTASVIAVTPVVVFEIDKESFELFLASNAQNRSRISEFIRLGKLLIASPIFSFMSQKQIFALLTTLKPERFPPNVSIFKQGDSGDKFYLIQEGKIRLERVENGKRTLDVVMERGDFFGETALVKNIPRTASASTVAESLLFVLNKEQFCSIISRALFGGRELDSLINKRASQLGEEALKSCLRN